jgi:MFS family permease
MTAPALFAPVLGMVVDRVPRRRFLVIGNIGSAAMMLPLLLSMAPGGVSRLAPPPFNLVISNVPGPKRPLYFNGARLQGIYPLSIPTIGQALNITVTSYAGNMEFGLIGCRRSVPHLQRLLTHLDDALEELVKVTGA